MGKIKKLCIVISLIGLLVAPSYAKTFVKDIAVYGGTSAGVVAAIQAAREGKSVILIAPEAHLGAMSSAGLGFTDSGKTATVGGASKEFYHRIWKEYQKPESWKFGKTRAGFRGSGQGTKAIDDEKQLMWIFEPSVAERVYDKWLEEEKVPVLKKALLDRSKKGIVKRGSKIASIRLLNGDVVKAKVFIDATFEGDLMALANCSYHVGRESKEVYKEKWNGNQLGVLHHSHHFKKPVDPYKVEGDKNSGVLKHIFVGDPGKKHEGDKKLQAYCFRMCLTTVKENRVPFPKPANYNAEDYELLLRYIKAENITNDGYILKNDWLVNGKTDTNNQGAFSTDFIGGNYDYPEASYEERKKIIQAHKDYQQGFLYFLANDPRVPEKLQNDVKKWGLAKDEFTDTQNWPFNLYIREARRMIGDYVMTEHDCKGKIQTPKSIGMGSYTLDSHNTQRYIKSDGVVQNEGDIGEHCPPYKIAYGSITPKREECTNLLVTNACSASHIAYGSIRMEPVFMILGHSAATAAAISINDKCAVQDVDYEKLSAKLLKDGQVLTLK